MSIRKEVNREKKISNNKIKKNVRVGWIVPCFGTIITPSLAMQQLQLPQRAQVRPLLSTPLVFVYIVQSRAADLTALRLS